MVVAAERTELMTVYRLLSIPAGIMIMLAAAGCSSNRAALGPDEDGIKEMVTIRYDRFAASGGEVCEQ
jgi:hypothetical protein